MFWRRPLPQRRDREAESDLLTGQTGPGSVQDVGGTVPVLVLAAPLRGRSSSWLTDQLIPHVIIWGCFIRHQLVLMSLWKTGLGSVGGSSAGSGPVVLHSVSLQCGQ